MPLRSKGRTKPTQYPFIPFHALRSAQLISSIIVAGIMSYFLWQLDHENYRLPWTFILLLLVSLLTLTSLTITIILHLLHGLSPTLNLSLNTTLFILWGISFAMLSWWSSSTLTHVCNRKNWDDDMGVGVCRSYKALFSFALVGCVATLGALVLDLYIQRQATRLGKYNTMPTTLLERDGDRKTDGLDEADGASEYDVFEDVDTEYNPNPSARKKKSARGGQEYEVPDEQFRYEDEDQAGDLGERSGRI